MILVDVMIHLACYLVEYNGIVTGWKHLFSSSGSCKCTTLCILAMRVYLRYECDNREYFSFPVVVSLFTFSLRFPT